MSDIAEQLLAGDDPGDLAIAAAAEIKRLRAIVWEENHMNDGLRREIEHLRASNKELLDTLIAFSHFWSYGIHKPDATLSALTAGAVVGFVGLLALWLLSRL
jgi:uncharacterized ubiquitin-like protein YukD